MALAGETWLLLLADPHLTSCMVRMAKVIPDPEREHDPSGVLPTLTSARPLIALSVESDTFPLTSSSTSY